MAPLRLRLLRPARPQGAARRSRSTPTRRWTVTSNSAPDRVEDADDGGRRWTFADTPRLSTYVTVVNAGPFHELRSRARRPRPRPLLPAVAQAVPRARRRGAVRPHRAAAWRSSASASAQPFPQERYDQVFVPNMGGAMENWGSRHLDRQRALPQHADLRPAGRPVAQILLHEMAHMWFGDLVTMRWWDDLWLNEAFASWASNWAGGQRHAVHRRLGHVPRRPAS